MPQDAEAWLAERGVERRSLVATPDSTGRGPVATVSDGSHGKVAPDVDGSSAAGAADTLDDPDVTRALAFVRNSTARAPQAERRLRDKLAGRGFDDACIEQALHRARRMGIVDDPRLGAALVEERRRRGHAAARIRRDLIDRGFARELLDELLAGAAAEDPEAAAFDVARRRADELRGLDVETAYRRVVGHVRRRGHTDGIARKVAREAVFASREEQRSAEH